LSIGAFQEMIEFDRQMKKDIWMVEDDGTEGFDENESEKLFYDDLCETFPSQER